MRKLLCAALLLCICIHAQIIGGRNRKIFSGGGGFTGCTSGFSHCIQLTIDHTKVGSSSSTNFPVTVSGSNAILKDSGHSGHVNSSSGADILFYSASGSNPGTQIASEIEFYDNVNGVLVAHVEIASVSNTSDTNFWIEYGNASPPSRTTNPWNTGFVAVYHFPNGTTLTTNDSTSNALNLTAPSVAANAGTGVVDGAVSMVSSTQYLENAPGSAFYLTAWTISAWVNPSASGFGTNDAVITHTNNTPSDLRNYELSYETSGKPRCGYTKTSGSTTYDFVDAASAVSTSVWHHLACTYDGANLKIYVDGSLSGTLATTDAPDTNSGSGLYFNVGANAHGAYGNFTGLIDEARVENAARSADWITAMYNNMNAPGNIGSAGFLTWGTEH